MSDTAALTTGLRIIFDEKNLNFPVSDLLADDAPIHDQKWPLTVYLDQNGDGACAGFMAIYELDAEPVHIKGITDALGFQVYREAQKVDEWPGEAYEGTSLNAVMKILEKMGYISGWNWCFGINDYFKTMSNLGPVGLGIPWYDSMFTPTSEGRLTISGVARSGHAIISHNLEYNKGRAWIRNQWNRKADGSGSHWGINGEAWFDLQDLDKILRQGGQAVFPKTRIDTNPVTPKPPEPTFEIPYYESFITYEQMRYRSNGAGVIWTKTGKYDKPPGVTTSFDYRSNQY